MGIDLIYICHEIIGIKDIKDRHEMHRNRYNYVNSCVTFMLEGKQLRNTTRATFRSVYLFYKFTANQLKLFRSDGVRITRLRPSTRSAL